MEVIKIIIGVLVIMFFVLIIIAAIAVIVNAILYMIYQKTDRIIFSPFSFSYCKQDLVTYSLYYKNKKIDSMIFYRKYKGACYVVGANGIYKIRKSKLTVLNEENTSESEKEIVEDLKREAKRRISEHRQLLDTYYLTYTADDNLNNLNN